MGHPPRIILGFQAYRDESKTDKFIDYTFLKGNLTMFQNEKLAYIAVILHQGWIHEFRKRGSILRGRKIFR